MIIFEVLIKIKMKKSYMMIAALPLLLAACGSDDSLTVTPENVEVKCGETTTLTASNKNVIWTSLDADIATVDSKGVVKGMHVGETRIEAEDKDGNNGSSVVKVIAANNNFKEPLLAWNSKKSAIETAMTSWDNMTLDSSSDDEALVYTANGGFPMYAYGFDNNGGLLSSILAVSEDMDTDLDLEGWLDERYWYQVKTEDDEYIYYDAKTEADATMMIIYCFDADLNAVTVTWTPMSNTKADDMTRAAKSAAFNALRKAIRK